jgi:hypothetical protein
MAQPVVCNDTRLGKILGSLELAEGDGGEAYSGRSSRVVEWPGLPAYL